MNKKMKNDSLSNSVTNHNNINLSIRNNQITLYCKFMLPIDSDHVIINSYNVSLMFKLKLKRNNSSDLFKELSKFKNKNFKFNIEENIYFFSYTYTISLKQFKKLKSKTLSIKQYNDNISMDIIIDLNELTDEYIQAANQKKKSKKIHNIAICHNPKPYQGGKFSKK